MRFESHFHLLRYLAVADMVVFQGEATRGHEVVKRK